MIRTVMFFDKHRGNSQFIERIVYSLKAINISQDEVLYHTNDKAEFIYFIFQGKFKLVIDVNDYMSTTSKSIVSSSYGSLMHRKRKDEITEQDVVERLSQRLIKKPEMQAFRMYS
jgi:predicted RNA-binding protein with PIN domain